MKPMKTTSLFALGLVTFVGAVPLAAQGCSDSSAGDDGGTTPPSATTTTPAPTTPPTTEPTTPPTEAGSDAAVVSCTAALENALKPIDKVTTGQVLVLDDSAGARLLFVDATAGGAAGASTNPRTYVDLGAGKRVDVSDKAAQTSTDWDLALERAVIFTNGGHGGAGAGGALLVSKPFADVTAADVAGKTFPAERFVDESCAPIVDQTNAIKTTFDGWYDYDLATSKVAPKNVTFVVKGGKGALYKVAITQYYATPDGGGPGLAGANYTLRVGAL